MARANADGSTKLYGNVSASAELFQARGCNEEWRSCGGADRGLALVWWGTLARPAAAGDKLEVQLETQLPCRPRDPVALEADQGDACDAAAAARLVLGPRATRVPIPDTSDEDQEGKAEQAAEQQDQPATPNPAAPESGDDQEGGAKPPLEEIVLEAAKSAIPAGLLARFFLETRPDAPLAAAQTRAFAAEDLAGGGR